MVTYLHELAQGRNIAGPLPEHGSQQGLEQGRHVEGWQFPRVQFYQLSKNLEHIWMELLQTHQQFERSLFLTCTESEHTGGGEAAQAQAKIPEHLGIEHS